jgi:hypothetical protein
MDFGAGQWFGVRISAASHSLHFVICPDEGTAPAIDVIPRKIMTRFLIQTSFCGRFESVSMESSLSNGRKTALIQGVKVLSK